jgi:hypothetical protein
MPAAVVERAGQLLQQTAGARRLRTGTLGQDALLQQAADDAPVCGGPQVGVGVQQVAPRRFQPDRGTFESMRSCGVWPSGLFWPDETRPAGTVPTGHGRRRRRDPADQGLASKRFAKRQQMQWTKRGAHLLLQTRTRTLDGSLRSLFERWFPGLASSDATDPQPLAA